MLPLPSLNQTDALAIDADQGIAATRMANGREATGPVGSATLRCSTSCVVLCQGARDPVPYEVLSQSEGANWPGGHNRTRLLRRMITGASHTHVGTGIAPPLLGSDQGRTPDGKKVQSAARGPRMAAPPRKPRLNAEQRRALETLDRLQGGCTRSVWVAHGFTFPMLVGLVRDGLADVQGETVTTRGWTTEIMRIRITAVGRRALEA